MQRNRRGLSKLQRRGALPAREIMGGTTYRASPNVRGRPGFSASANALGVVDPGTRPALAGDCRGTHKNRLAFFFLRNVQQMRMLFESEFLSPLSLVVLTRGRTDRLVST